MSRIVTVGAAQLGPIQRADSRAAVVARMLDLLRQAGEHRCDLVVFPELALTTFFPRWWMEDQDEIDSFFEREMPSNETAPLFNEARARGIGFYLGFAELARENGATRRFNTSILIDGSGRDVGSYRKIHLPGHAEHEPWRAFQHLEKRYFEIGDLGWPVWRAMGGALRHVHLQRPPLARDLSHRWGCRASRWCCSATTRRATTRRRPTTIACRSSTTSSRCRPAPMPTPTWVVGVAKCGVEEGCEMIGNSSIVAPTGEVVAQALTQGDELVIARCDLDLGRSYKATTFNFARHRQPEQYRMIVERRGAVEPE